MRRSLHAGMSLVDVIVGSALILIVFMGLFGILRASIKVAGLSKLKAVATEVASSQIEYIRSLPYASVGTSGGIPAGAIPQIATTTNDGVPYVTRTYIEYVDDPKDGLAGADVNHITTDYKHVKVTTSYVIDSIPRQVTLLTNVVPKGLESTTGGGTLQVTVVNALGAPVSGADVRIRNASTSPAIDLSTFSDVLGTVYLPGAPTSTQYRVDVSKTGYSSAQTYLRDATNQNPTPGYLTVVGGSTTSGTFAIDLLTTLIVRTFSPIVAALWSDTFSDSSNVQTFSGTVVSGGALVLTGAPSTYGASGSALSNPIAPAYLARWTSASTSLSVPTGTSVSVHVHDAAGALLPDAALPGNSTGFTGTIDLSAISTTTYPALALRAALSSSDPLFTPSVLDWKVGYDQGPLPLPNISFTLTGGKTIGSTGAGASIYKTTISTSTGSVASSTLSLEWDSYTLSVPGHTIILEEPESPYELLPGTALDATLILTP